MKRNALLVVAIACVVGGVWTLCVEKREALYMPMIGRLSLPEDVWHWKIDDDGTPVNDAAPKFGGVRKISKKLYYTESTAWRKIYDETMSGGDGFSGDAKIALYDNVHLVVDESLAKIIGFVPAKGWKRASMFSSVALTLGLDVPVIGNTAWMSVPAGDMFGRKDEHVRYWSYMEYRVIRFYAELEGDRGCAANESSYVGSMYIPVIHTKDFCGYVSPDSSGENMVWELYSDFALPKDGWSKAFLEKRLAQMGYDASGAVSKWKEVDSVTFFNPTDEETTVKFCLAAPAVGHTFRDKEEKKIQMYLGRFGTSRFLTANKYDGTPGRTVMGLASAQSIKIRPHTKLTVMQYQLFAVIPASVNENSKEQEIIPENRFHCRLLHYKAKQ